MKRTGGQLYWHDDLEDCRRPPYTNTIERVLSNGFV